MAAITESYIWGHDVTFTFPLEGGVSAEVHMNVPFVDAQAIAYIAELAKERVRERFPDIETIPEPAVHIGERYCTTVITRHTVSKTAWERIGQ